MTDKQELTDRLKRAGIPALHRRKTLLDCGARGKELRAMLEGDDYREMVKDGIGFHMHGGTDIRVFTFPVFIKETCLWGDGVMLVSMRELATAVIHGTPELDRYRRVDVLAITGFQQTGYDVCPYSAAERSVIEDFLTGRIEDRRRHHLSASAPILKCMWWTDDLRNLLAPTLQEFSFGGK